MKERAKKILIIAGPNGAGKTTFAEEFLPNEANCRVFINADLIARGLSPFAPDDAAIEAGKMMLRQIAAHVAAGRSFAFETTLSGRSYARHIADWQKPGYHVRLIFLRLPSARVALRRVRSRVRQGGHAIPAAVVHRRFKAGWNNFTALYRDLVDSWVIYDNSGDNPLRMESGERK